MIPSNADILNQKIKHLLNPSNTGYSDISPRDVNQSLMAGTVPAGVWTKAQPNADRTGVVSLQVAGGTRTHVPMMEGYNPFEENRTFRKAYPDALLTCLVRGDASFVYKPQPDDVTFALLKHTVHSGINGYTIFDGSGDVRQQEFAIKTINQFRDAGHPVYAQAGLLIGSSPVLTMDYYKSRADRLAAMNPAMFYLKDPVGDADPERVAEVVELLKQYNIPIQVHAHDTHGKAKAILVTAFEAGANYLDTAHPSLAGNTGHPSILDIHGELLRNKNPAAQARVPKIDVAAIEKDANSAAILRLQYSGIEPKYNKDTRQAMGEGCAPGGAGATLRKQFEVHFKNTFGMNWDQAEETIYRVQKPLLPLLGDPVQVTPHAKNTSAQSAASIIFAIGMNREFKDTLEQAVKQGQDRAQAAKEIIRDRYAPDPAFMKSALIARMTPDMVDYLTGKLGEIPGVPDADVQAEALRRAGLVKVLSERPASLLAPRMEKTKARLAAEGYGDMPEELVVLAAIDLPTLNEGHDFAVKAHKGELTPKPAPQLPVFLQEDKPLHPYAPTIAKIAHAALEIQKLEDGFYKAEGDPQERVIALRQSIAQDLDSIRTGLKAEGKSPNTVGRAMLYANQTIEQVSTSLGVTKDNVPQFGLNYKFVSKNDHAEIFGMENVSSAASCILSGEKTELVSLFDQVSERIENAGLLNEQKIAAVEHFNSLVKAEVVRQGNSHAPSNVPQLDLQASARRRYEAEQAALAAQSQDGVFASMALE